jgi:hypothetical protein
MTQVLSPMRLKQERFGFVLSGKTANTLYLRCQERRCAGCIVRGEFGTGFCGAPDLHQTMKSTGTHQSLKVSDKRL